MPIMLEKQDNKIVSVTSNCILSDNENNMYNQEQCYTLK